MWKVKSSKDQGAAGEVTGGFHGAAYMTGTSAAGRARSSDALQQNPRSNPSNTRSRPEQNGNTMPYQVPLIFHPTLHVADLDGASTWVSEVFGRDALRWNERWDFSKINSDYPLITSFLFHIGDTLVDVFAPTLYSTAGYASASGTAEG